MTPTLEIGNQIFEFPRPTMKMRLAYNKATQDYVFKHLQNSQKEYTVGDMQKVNQLMEQIKSGEITAERFEKDKDLQEQMLKQASLIQDLDVTVVNYEYVKKMLVENYKLKDEKVEELLEQAYNEYGSVEFQMIINSICELVFIEAEVKTKKPLPDWAKSKR